MSLARGIIVALLTLSCSSEPEPHPAWQGAVNSGGALAGAPHVAELLDATTGALRCSASLIGLRTLLTAAHCVGPKGSPLAARFEAPSLTVVVPVNRAQVHPQFQVRGAMASSFEHDLALLQLTEAAPVAPAALQLSGDLAVADTVSVIGYGRTAGTETDEGTRRRGEVQIAQLTEATFELRGEQLPCLFDSGGAVMNEDGALQLGAISTGDAACTDHARVMRVDTAADFIRRGLEELESQPLASLGSAPSSARCEAGGRPRAGGEAIVGSLIGWSLAVRRKRARRSSGAEA